jgi:hypothetical protein
MRDDFEEKVFNAVKKGEIVRYSVRAIYEGTDPIPVRLVFEAYGNQGFKLAGPMENPAAGARTAIPQ